MAKALAIGSSTAPSRAYEEKMDIPTHVCQFTYLTQRNQCGLNTHLNHDVSAQCDAEDCETGPQLYGLPYGGLWGGEQTTH